MNLQAATLELTKVKFLRFRLAIAATAIISSFCLSPSALAHHPLGGDTPANVIEGFLSGLGHPVIGLEHLAFVIAAGLLAAAIRQGLQIPLAFVGASLAGTGLHWMALGLPAPELIISASVLVFGILLAMSNRPNGLIVLGLAAIAGLFHGYAYGEAIIGAEMGPLFSYLLGFALIQMAIAFAAYGITKQIGKRDHHQGLHLRFAGFTLVGIGSAFLSGVLLG
ncbi:HupE/UreJ family protein [Oscillatoria sp. CS-180]|uniref:HupE/UreJ family protein n=1 Tax=Oscillatoria sp. CS-180 TaxID=3021720 RepID=UPI00232F5678|nr:HupE/UreJ family protein [Oscillatoria sp. CS-180]MDB9527329.1 HupE/UreJ family protein [Oscillatoria sp. CS-180]